ncbi:MAG: hypothetical protein JAY64_09600 [Candidatus Thiodiazotropha weberae]|nr:hypothetical protein [Candidatus Thiodiazotropha lotti]MCG8011942.1 hypothetical protein [Candidatus Thiodiazotropha lotti]MCW4211409.1 hypothetical protein [Candidatus Thiodiazotropha lotti]MCW4216769.1 hypothetical protein [Candidatus Thiodiazotropha lotti]
MKTDNNDDELKSLKDSIQEGISDLKTGKVNDGKTVIDRLRKRVINQEAGGNDKQPLESLTLLKILAQSSQDIQEGRSKPVDKAFADIRNKIQGSI